MLLAVFVLVLLLGFGEAKKQKIYPDTDKRPMCPCSLNTVSGSVEDGQDAPNTTFPYSGYFLVGEPNFIRCGATLISDRHLITTAHCLYEYSKMYDKDFGFLVPQLMLKIKLNRFYKFDVTVLYDHIKFAIHPDFGNYKNFSHYDYKNDIAIVELLRPVPWIHGIKAAVLPSPRLKLKHGETVSQCGWGMLDKVLLNTNSTQCVEMLVLGNVKCQNSLKTPVESNMLCAEGVKRHSPCRSHPCRGQLPCMMDTGGGLLVRLENHNILCGLMSFGKFRSAIQAHHLIRECSKKDDKPVGYTRVSSYIDWIYSNTMSSDCKPCIYNRPGRRGK